MGVAQAPVIGRENGVKAVRSGSIRLSSRQARNWTVECSDAVFRRPGRITSRDCGVIR